MTTLPQSLTPVSWVSRRFEQPDPPPLPVLQAGPVDVLLDGIDLRWGEACGVEFLRRLCVAVRDERWRTLLPSISELRIDQAEGSFAVEFHAVHQNDPIWFEWDGEIRGDASGRLSYSMRGVCKSDFVFNRIGVCVLHPADAAGGAYSARTPSGTSTGALTESIGPQRIDSEGIHGLFAPFDRLELEIDGLAVIHEFRGRPVRDRGPA